MENVPFSLCNQLLSAFFSSNGSYFEISLISLLLAYIFGLLHFKVFYSVYVLHTQCVIFLNLSLIMFFLLLFLSA